MNEFYSYVYNQLDRYFAPYEFDSSRIEIYTKYVIRGFKNLNDKEAAGDRAIMRFIELFENCEAYLRRNGYSETESIEGAKHLVTNYRNSNFSPLMYFAKTVNLQDRVYNHNFNFLKNSPELIHARYKYLLSIGYKGDMYLALIRGEKPFSKQFGVHSEQLKVMYPLTDEIKKIHRFLATKSDEFIFENYGVTREQLATIYPDNKKTLAVLRKLKSFSDRDINNMFGISREVILSTPCLDYEKVKAVNNIHSFSSRRVKELLGLEKELVLAANQDWEENSKILNKKIGAE